MHASVLVVLMVLLSGAAKANDAPLAPDEESPPAPLPSSGEAVDPAAEPEATGPSSSSDALEKEPEPKASAPSSSSDPVVDEGSSIPTWLYTVPLGCVTFTAVWMVASAVLSPLNAVAGLGGIIALVLAAVSSSYAQVAVGDYFGKRRGSVLPGAIASGLTTLGCMVPGFLGVAGVFYVGFFGTFAVLAAALQAGNVDPNIVVAQLAAAGAVGVALLGLTVVGILATLFGAILAGQGASAIAYQFFADPLTEGDDGGFEVPGFMKPAHPAKPGEDDEEDRVFAPPLSRPRAALLY
jgi:hypothetical protein